MIKIYNILENLLGHVFDYSNGVTVTTQHNFQLFGLMLISLILLTIIDSIFDLFKILTRKGAKL